MLSSYGAGSGMYCGARVGRYGYGVIRAMGQSGRSCGEVVLVGCGDLWGRVGWAHLRGWKWWPVLWDRVGVSRDFA